MVVKRMLKSKIFYLIVIWRLSSVFIVQSTHVPDEYWQSLEVAHRKIFGYGYLTWEWQIGIRSYLYPSLISILFFFLKILRLDYLNLLIYLPRIFHALLAAYADYRFYLWTGSKFALFNFCINWYWYYCCSRTLINSLETCLSLIAITEFPWSTNQLKNLKFLWIVGFLCAARPTAAIVWVPLCSYHLYKYKNFFYYLIGQYLKVGLITFIASTLLDSYCYNKFVLTPLNFLKVNAIQGISEQYGMMSSHWYLTLGLPVLLGVNYLIFAAAIFKIFSYAKKSEKSIICILTITWTIFCYSLLKHKEFRFVLPLLPLFIYVINDSIFNWMNRSTGKFKMLLSILVLTNVIPGFYFSLLHQQSGLQIMEYLANDVKIFNHLKANVLFLTKCHATPFYSHLHQNISMNFLTCEPNLHSVENYLDEADIFFQNPTGWLDIHLLNHENISFPSHIITYDTTAFNISKFLKDYILIGSIKDSHFLQDGFNAMNIFKYSNL